PALSIYKLALPLAFGQFPNLLLVGAARHTGRALCLRRRFLSRHALQLLTFLSILNVFCVHSSTLIPAYFSTIFFNPNPGKLIVSFASSPSPSRRRMVPRPYFG